MNLKYERKAPPKHPFAKATKIIWHPDEVKTYYDRPRNSLCMFRKTFELEQLPKEAVFSLFADTRYVAYINGEKIGRGPVRSDPRWQFYDKYDILPYLKEGKNVIAVEVLYYGYSSGHSIDRIPAFCGEAQLKFSGGKTEIISSDSSYKVCLSDALSRVAPRTNGCKGPIEVWDMEKLTEFYALDFDDTDWQDAKGRDVTLSPFWNLYERTIPYIKEKYTPARAIVGAGKGKTAKGFDNSTLHQQIKAEVDALSLNHVYSLGCEVELSPHDKSEFNYIMVDFDKVRAGYIDIEIDGYAGDIVDVVYAEELCEGKPLFDNISYRPMSRFVLKDGANHLKTKYNYEAFRYVLLIIRNHVKTANVSKVGITERFLDYENQTEFTTKDEKLQKIWDISVNTLKLCMQDGFLDSPSREQQQWMGDGRFQAQMNYYITGDSSIHEKLLLQMSESQDREGMTTSRYPDGNHNLPPIPSFCLQWICSFGDYYKFTGKTEIIKDLWNSIILGIRWFSGYENEDGLLENLPYWQYYDMSKDENGNNADFYRGGIITLPNLMYAEAMETVVFLAKLTDDTEAERFFANKLRKLKKNIYTKLWNKEKGAYSDCMVDGVLSECVSESANAMAIIMLHKKTDKRAIEIIKNVFDKETRHEIIYRVSPYFMAPYYKALHKVERDDIALSETYARYAEMLEIGATSTWEHWDLFTKRPEGVTIHSACHAWASAPILFVAESIAGLDIKGKTPTVAPMKDVEEFHAKFVTSKGEFEIEN